MRKQTIKRSIIVIVVFLIALVAFGYSYYKSNKESVGLDFYELFLRDSKPAPNPDFLGDYPDDRWGFYQFNPQTILASLDQGKTDIFTPLLADPNDVDVEYDDIKWTQSDFLRVANALNQRVWNEPLDLDNWSVYNVFFGGDCDDNFDGFNEFTITYYKRVKIGWDMVYTARHLDLIPWKGMAKWGGDGEFSYIFIFPWRNIELTKFKTTAEDAVRIADENGGKATRSNDKNCSVHVYVDESSWDISYDTTTPLNVFISPFTGEVKSKK
jgi:hypothetical protein